MNLYRRRRPLSFADMTGQEHITRTLSNALLSERLAHAYLFCGPRGTGKTTAAKILARAMNCEHYPVSEPCGKCVPCQNIAAGVSIDVIEMDAASNRGIDEIRELREKSRFASGESRHKIYIIDEAHMLTTEACNAFLKTLEEPPRNVIFILATTDPSRLPLTIVSRCQRFDFHLITAEQIKQRLEQIMELEGWQAEKEAISLISRLAEGSLRDALGILEQCSAYSEGNITADHVREVTGTARAETIGALVEAAVKNDLDSGMSVLEQVVYSGIDLNLFLRDLTFVFTRLLLEGRTDDKKTGSNMYGFEDLILTYRGRIDRKTLLDAVELFHEVGLELRHAHFPQYILEVAFIRLVRLLHGRYEPAAAIDPKSASDQVASADSTELRAEEKKGEKPASAIQDKAIKIQSVQSEATGSGDVTTVRADKGKGHRSVLQESWPRLLQNIKRKQKSTAAWLEPALIGECQGNIIRLTYTREYSIHQIRIMEDNHRKLVEAELSGFLGSPVNLKAIIIEGDSPVPDKCAPADSAGKQAAEESGKKKGSGIKEAMEIFGGEIIDTD